MPLSKDEVSSLRSILEQRRDRLRAETRSEAFCASDRDLSELAPDVRDPGDEALAIQMSDFNISALEKETRDLRETEAALRRIQEGRYGECEDCGGDIPVERLRAYPWARRCTRCQARLEMQNRGHDRTPSL